MMMDIVREVMFDNAYLDQASGHVTRCNSHAVVMQGNRVMINGTLIKSGDGATDSLLFTLEGSYDGQVWLTTGLGSLTISTGSTPGNASSSIAIDDVDYAYLRLRAEVTKVDTLAPRALFDAGLIMSYQ